MSDVLHITSGDCAGGSLSRAGLPGEVFVWHDILYEGPRKPGWPDNETLQARAVFLERATGGGLDRVHILATLETQYRKLEHAAGTARIVLWFDACLFDQAMLAHILACLRLCRAEQAALLCVDRFPGVEPYDGLGQLSPEQLASVYDQRADVTAEQFDFAELVDRAFALQDKAVMAELSRLFNAPLPQVPAAALRWLQEQPDPRTGLGRLDRLILDALRRGARTPLQLMEDVSARDTHPIFWGDTMLWAKVNALAGREPPLVEIQGPADRLPQWEPPPGLLARFNVAPAQTQEATS